MLFCAFRFFVVPLQRFLVMEIGANPIQSRCCKWAKTVLLSKKTPLLDVEWEGSGVVAQKSENLPKNCSFVV